MFEFITAPENIPFAVALLVLLIIALLEGVGAMFGAGISNIFGGLFPDIDVNIEGPDLDSSGTLGRVLSWLRIGQVPVLVLIIVFLVGFGISGLILQKFLWITFGFMLPAAIASVPAFMVALPTVRVLGGALNAIIPKDETSAVSQDSFIGRIATITLGESKATSPAEGKVKDSFGKYHYIMIEPDNKTDSFAQGSEVLLVRQNGSIFYAIKSDNHIMTEA